MIIFWKIWCALWSCYCCFLFLILRFALFSYYWRVSVYQIQYFWYKYCLKSVQIRSFSGPFFFCIRTEYGEMRSISPYSVRVRENTDQKKLRIWTLFAQLSGSCYNKTPYSKVFLKYSCLNRWEMHGEICLNDLFFKFQVARQNFTQKEFLFNYF